MEIYIRLVSHCNMTCAHCCFSAERKRQPVMSREVFGAALRLVEELKTMCTIGGGEPTMHPEFESFVNWATLQLPMWADGMENCVPTVHCVTNGKIKSKALWLANQARRQKLSVRLSQDYFHDPIDPEVIAAFDPDRRPDLQDSENYDHLPYMEHEEAKIWLGHNKLHSVHATGRGKQLPYAFKMDPKEEMCVCSSVFVQPDGEVYSCGCLVERIGHVAEMTALLDFIRSDEGDEYSVGVYCGRGRLAKRAAGHYDPEQLKLAAVI